MKQDKKNVFRRIVQESDAYAANFERNLEQIPRWKPEYHQAFVELSCACRRVLRAEAVLGDAAHAIELCTKASGRIETWLHSLCQPDDDKCRGLTAAGYSWVLEAIDQTFNEVKATEPYQGISQQRSKSGAGDGLGVGKGVVVVVGDGAGVGVGGIAG